ncbi:peptide chain release factor N(5)-glutamine methyltransferase [Pseudoflavonifractor sp. MSJ-30]|uniref:peptide chain release factor N(5)-glutamine methyltransferase n=1 Tax=Pseudoflavonifractor sp. MSJ-30 TaxID=2841525 RepID=UPI001C0FC89A
MKTYGDLYIRTRDRLTLTETPETAGPMARDLVSTLSGMTQEAFLAERDKPVPEELTARVDMAVDRYLAGEPLPYVLGEWTFYGLDLYVSPDVLIPRDDTCAVAELAIHRGLFLDQNPRILDLCCGSGCIGLAIASRLKDARVTLADLSGPALSVARKNIQRNHMGGRVSCVQVDAMEAPPAFLGKFDMIVSNPPYVTASEMEELPGSVKKYEPHMALFGGTDGLNFYRAITKNFRGLLKPGGFLCYEFGMGQGDAVCAILEENGFTVLERTLDFNERERAVLAQYGRKGI